MVHSDNPWQPAADHTHSSNHTRPPIEDHSDPVSAIPQRDLRALQDYFEHRDMAAIAADIEAALTNLWPNPVWDDDSQASLPADTTASTPQPTQSQGVGQRFERYL